MTRQTSRSRGARAAHDSPGSPRRKRRAQQARRPDRAGRGGGFRGEPGGGGVVITHGTNTLEETAYFLNLTVSRDLGFLGYVDGAALISSFITTSTPLPRASGAAAVHTAFSRLRGPSVLMAVAGRWAPTRTTGRAGRVIPLPAYDERGMIAGDTLNPQKARILLMLALSKTRDLDEIRRIP